MERNLPEGWEWKDLRDVADIQSGYLFPITLQGQTSGDYPFAKVSDISTADLETGGVLDKAANYISSEDVKNLGAKIFPIGTTFFAKRGEAIKLNRRAISTVNSLADNNLMGLLPKENIVMPKYLFYFMKTIDFRTYIKTTAIPAINNYSLDSINVPLPSLETQRRIVAILDKAEEIKGQRVQANRLAGLLAMSIFYNMFGDPRYNNKGWKMVTPPDIASSERNAITIGPFGSDLMAKDYRDNGIPLVFVRNIRENRFQGDDTRYIDYSKADELRAHQVKPGDILMTKMGDPPGDVSIYPENSIPGIITADCIKLTINPRIANSLYVLWALKTSYVRNQVIKNTKGAAQQKINLTIFKSIKLPLPPIEHQNVFVKKIEQAEKISALEGVSNCKIEHLFSTLMQMAFIGDLKK